jgi:hypothetical protein
MLSISCTQFDSNPHSNGSFINISSESTTRLYWHSNKYFIIQFSSLAFFYIDLFCSGLASYALVYGTNITIGRPLTVADTNSLANNVCRFSFVICISYLYTSLADECSQSDRNHCQ